MRSLDFPSDDLARNDLDRFQHPCPHVQRLDDYRDGRLEAVRQRDFKGRPNKLRDHATDLGVHFRDHPPTTVARAEVERLTGLNRYLVGHLPRPWPFRRRSGRRGTCPRPAHRMPPVSLPLPSGRTLPAPLKRRRVRIPVIDHGREPGHDLARIGRMAAGQRPTLQHPLDAFGHVQPRSTDRREQRHDPVREQP